MSGTVASQMDPNATAGSKMNNYGSGLNDTKQSGISGQVAIKKGAKDELDKLEKEKREKRGGMNNIRNLIREAYEDSDSKSPIFFLITHSVNIQDIITEFLTKKVSTSSSLKPWFFSMEKESKRKLKIGLLEQLKMEIGLFQKICILFQIGYQLLKRSYPSLKVKSLIKDSEFG